MVGPLRAVTRFYAVTNRCVSLRNHAKARGKGTVPQNYHEILNEVSNDWQHVFVLTGVNDHYIGVLSHTFYCYWAEEYRSLYRGLRYIGVRYIGILSHTFYYYWTEEHRSLYRGLRYIGFRYIGVRFHTLNYYWAEEFRSLYWGLRYRGVRYIEILFHKFYYYWAEEYRSLYWGLRYIGVVISRFFSINFIIIGLKSSVRYI